MLKIAVTLWTMVYPPAWDGFVLRRNGESYIINTAQTSFVFLMVGTNTFCKVTKNNFAEVLGKNWPLLMKIYPDPNSANLFPNYRCKFEIQSKITGIEVKIFRHSDFFLHLSMPILNF